jgi:hypothetical protein
MTELVCHDLRGPIAIAEVRDPVLPAHDELERHTAHAGRSRRHGIACNGVRLYSG